MLEDRLKNLRKQMGVTQDELAAHLNVKRQSYGAYERGVSIPDSISLQRIAEYFKVSTDYLLGLTENPSPINEVFAVYVKNGGDYSDLPPEALTELDNYRQYLREKYKKK